MGIFVFFCYIAAGCLIACRMRLHRSMLYSLWLGGVLGLTGMIWLPVVWALATGHLNLTSQLLGMGTMVLAFAAIFLAYRGKPWAAWTPEDQRILRPMLYFAIPLTALEAILLYNHVLLPQNGALYGGQCTYGDLSMHLGMITSMAEQGTFPPEYSILPGTLMGYPFLVNSLSSSIMILGNGLRAAVIVPSVAMVALIAIGFWLWFYQVSGRRRTATLAGLLFFVAGGIGFAYFLDGSLATPSNFTRIFTEYYNAPTNFPEKSLRWVNVLCDMILPQRTTMLGWVMIPAVLVLLRQAIDHHRNHTSMLLAGILVGSMPMMHTHSFVAVGIVGIGWALAAWPWKMGIRAWRQALLDWLWFLVPVMVLALPQLMTWTLRQSASDGFVRLQLGWVNTEDPFLWFWFKNLGLPFLLLFPALWHGWRKYLAWYTGGIVIFVIGQLLCFQPNPYDNNKLLLVWWMLSVIPIAEYMGILWDAMRRIPGRTYLGVAVSFFLFFSGVLTIAREIISGGQYQLYSQADLALTAYVENNTQPTDLFITGDQHLNPIAALAGRNIYAGSDTYLYFHGFDTSSRKAQVAAIYTDPEQAAVLPAQLGASYILVSDWERAAYPDCEEILDAIYPVAFYTSDGAVKLYRIS